MAQRRRNRNMNRLAQTEERQTHLLQAARNGHVSAFLDLLEMGMDPNHRNVLGDTPASTVVERGDLEMLQGLLQAGYLPQDMDCKNETPLSLAVKSHASLEILLELIKYGADPEAKNQYGVSALHQAVMNSDIDTVRLFMELQPDIHAKTTAGVPLMHFAIEEENPEMVDLLVEYGARLDAKDSNLHTALHIAADKGQKEIFDRLFEYYQENNIPIEKMRTMDEGWNPLMVAAMSGHVELLKDFVKHGVPLHLKDHDGRTALALAIEQDQVDVVRFLIEHGADVAKHDFDEDGQSLLHLAIESKRADQIIPILIQAGISVDTPNGDYMTPLAYAVEERNVKAVKYLLEAGADPNQSDISGRRPLDEVVRGYASATQDKIAKLLIDAGAEVNGAAMYKQAKTPLYHAFSQKNKSMIDLFIENGADITGQNPSDGQTPIFAACRQSSLELVEQAVKLGADITARDHQERNLLHIVACNNNNLPTLEYLVKNGLDVNAQDIEGKTPLHMVANGLWPRQVDCLIKAKANPNIADHNGDTVLHAMADKSNSYGLRNIADHMHHFDTCKMNKEGMTPLMLAACRGHRACVDILLEGPAKSLHLRNTFTNRTALSYAVEHNQAHVVEALISAGARDSEVNAKGQNLLHLAAMQNNGNILEALLPHMKDQVNQTDQDGETALFQAVRAGKLRHVIEILKHKPDLSMKNEAGQSVLDIANEQSNLDVYEVVFRAMQPAPSSPSSKRAPKR